VADSVRGGIVRSLAEPHKQQILELWASAFSLVEGEFYNFHAEAATRYRMLREFFGPVSSALLHSSRLGFGYFKVRCVRVREGGRMGTSLSEENDTLVARAVDWTIQDDGLLGMSYWSRPGQYRVSRRKVFKEVEFVIPSTRARFSVWQLHSTKESESTLTSSARWLAQRTRYRRSSYCNMAIAASRSSDTCSGT